MKNYEVILFKICISKNISIYLRQQNVYLTCLLRLIKNASTFINYCSILNSNQLLNIPIHNSINIDLKVMQAHENGNPNPPPKILPKIFTRDAKIDSLSKSWIHAEAERLYQIYTNKQNCNINCRSFGIHWRIYQGLSHTGGKNSLRNKYISLKLRTLIYRPLWIDSDRYKRAVCCNLNVWVSLIFEMLSPENCEVCGRCEEKIHWFSPACFLLLDGNTYLSKHSSMFLRVKFMIGIFIWTSCTEGAWLMFWNSKFVFRINGIAWLNGMLELRKIRSR